MGDAAVWTAVLIGAVGTIIWRVLGVAIETKVRQDSPLFVWIGCVAYAMVAGLMARVMLMPGGDLTLSSIGWRAGAFAVGFAVWYWRGKSVPLGLFAAVGAYGAVIYLGL